MQWLLAARLLQPFWLAKRQRVIIFNILRLQALNPELSYQTAAASAC